MLTDYKIYFNGRSSLNGFLFFEMRKGLAVLQRGTGSGWEARLTIIELLLSSYLTTSICGASNLYMTGVTSRERIVELISPPIITSASGE
jgi:hypothetical protein